PPERVHDRLSLRRYEGRDQHHLAHSPGTEFGNDTRYGHPGHRMADDHDVAETRGFDIADDGVYPLVDSGRGEVTGGAATTRQIHSQRPQFGVLAAQLRDEKVPAVGGVYAAVYQDQSG